jgi:hypothetical protein
MTSSRAYTFIGLNAVRVLSLIALLLLFCSSTVVMVHDIQAVNRFNVEGKLANSTITEEMADCDYIEGSTVPNQPAGAFWAVINRLFIIFQVIILFLSETGWPAKVFDRFIPVLGKNFGLGPLGVIQCLIGAAVLSHFVDDFSLVSAFFLFALGCINIIIGLIWHESAKSKRSITSWREQSKDVLPSNMEYRPRFSSVFGINEKYGDRDSHPSSKSGYGFGRQGEKAAALKGFLISKPVESLPRYMPRNVG